MSCYQSAVIFHRLVFWSGKMATLARIGTVAFRQKNGLFRPNLVRASLISTSKKAKDTVTLADTLLEKEQTKSETTAGSAAANKNWVSWGWSIRSEVEDNTSMHLFFFFSVSLCLVTGGFFWAYMPDYKMLNWAQREAYLELRRREAEGLLPIDANLIPVDKIELPSDEDLGDTEIII